MDCKFLQHRARSMSYLRIGTVSGPWCKRSRDSYQYWARDWSYLSTLCPAALQRPCADSTRAIENKSQSDAGASAYIAWRNVPVSRINSKLARSDPDGGDLW